MSAPIQYPDVERMTPDGEPLTRDYFAYGTKVLVSWDARTELVAVTTLPTRMLAYDLANALNDWEDDRTEARARKVLDVVKDQTEPIQRSIASHLLQVRP